MTSPNPKPTLPLWQVIEQDHHGLLSCSQTHADVYRGIANEMPLHFDPWLQEHEDVAEWLRSEAARAEQGGGGVMTDPKFTQIAVTSEEGCPDYIYALADDGIVYFMAIQNGSYWRPLPQLPFEAARAEQGEG